MRRLLSLLLVLLLIPGLAFAETLICDVSAPVHEYTNFCIEPRKTAKNASLRVRMNEQIVNETVQKPSP